MYDLRVGVGGLLRRQRVAEARLRRTVLRTRTRTEELRNGDRDQNGNDQHDHHQLDEGETLLAVPTSGKRMNGLIALGWPLSGNIEG